MARLTRATKYGNRYAMIEICNHITFVVKLLVVEKIFEKILGCDSRDNTESTNIDLF